MADVGQSAQRDEKIPRQKGAGVGRDAAKGAFAAAYATGDGFGRLGEAHHARLVRDKAARAMAGSENGKRLPAIS